ncbi:MAG TPA: sulfite exporter TauE/SafE family protein [Peptococcaceae bacterium]|nr:sulfite exporter TauE/SafE family protein [Peptococcaceae bacterium]
MFWVLYFIPIGMLVGTLSGFFGIGGGIMVMPILLLAGLKPALAVATSLMFTLGTSLSGAFTHTKMNNVNWKIAAVIGTVGALATQGSNRIVIYISGRYDWLLNFLFILLLLYFAWSLYQRQKKKTAETVAVIKNEYAAALFIGMIVGFLAALFGIGGGFITIPLLIKWLGFDSRKAIGTSLAAIIIISIGGILGYSARLELNFLLGLCLIGGAFIGSPFGARMTARYKVEEINRRLAILYFFVITSLLVDLIAAFTSPFLEYVSMGFLAIFLAYMLYDFYKHLHLPLAEEDGG